MALRRESQTMPSPPSAPPPSPAQLPALRNSRSWFLRRPTLSPQTQKLSLKPSNQQGTSTSQSSTPIRIMAGVIIASFLNPQFSIGFRSCRKPTLSSVPDLDKQSLACRKLNAAGIHNPRFHPMLAAFTARHSPFQPHRPRLTRRRGGNRPLILHFQLR